MKLKILVIKQDQKTPKKQKTKQEKEIASDNLYKFYSAREMVLNGFESKIFSTKSEGSGILNADRSKLKTLTPK